MPENNMKFQPMLKRFMVWDKISKQFRGDGKIFSWQEIACMLCPSPLDSEEEVQEREQRCELVQSTNLFAKDGKEIFEGSIVKILKGSDATSYVFHEGDMSMVRCYEDVACFGIQLGEKRCAVLGEYLKVVGHILSNPELVEG